MKNILIFLLLSITLISCSSQKEELQVSIKEKEITFQNTTNKFLKDNLFLIETKISNHKDPLCYLKNKEFDRSMFFHLVVLSSNSSMEKESKCNIKKELTNYLSESMMNYNDKLNTYLKNNNKEYWEDVIIRNYKHNISHANIISAFFKEDIESYNERVFNKFRKNEKLFKMVKYIIWNEGVELSEDKIVEFILDKRNQIIEADILASFYFLSKDNILKVHSFHQNNQALLGYLFESKLRKEEKEELFSLIPKNKKLKDFLNRGLLHLSAKYGNLEMVKYLKRKGFNDYLDKERHSAYDIAKMNNYHTLAFYIKNN